MKKTPFKQHAEIYSPQDILQVLQMAVNDKNLTGDNKGRKTYNIPCAFDIETTSFYRDEQNKVLTYEQVHDKEQQFEKCACMYVWQFGINGYCILGRTWNEFITMMNEITTTLQTCNDKRLIIYVHNLSYEFQFIRTLFEWDNVFSLDERKPIYARTVTGIEFRCSYLLSGYGLAKLGEQLHKYKCVKMTGDLDYSLLRHTETPLTEKEITYCINDIKVVMCYIQEQIEQYKGIAHLPVTKTGFVRKHCRRTCLRHNVDGKQKPNYKYIDVMHELTITSMKEFNTLQRAFMGGFTHANAHYSGETLQDVDSYDFTSSYPYVMVSEQYPMSRGVQVDVKSMKQFEFLCSKYCCVFDVEFTEIFATQVEHPISVSKCFVHEKEVADNGRLVCADRVVMTITNVDFAVFKKFYTWKQMRVGVMYCYRKEYLPTEFIQAILNLYAKKTMLKGVQGKEIEYLQSKEMLNSCYGMCATNPLRDEITYLSNEWGVKANTPQERDELLLRYNDSKNRFLFYPWGIFVTAYARRNLFTGINECGTDYVYSDTDSIKVLNGDAHKSYFETYNKQVEMKLKRACKYHGIPFEQCAPKTIKGVTKLLGVWDYEGRYSRFKTLGAKRYMIEENGEINITVSGVNKRTAVPYLKQTYGENVFNAFDNYMTVPPHATGKNIHTYIDYRVSGEMTDYTGRTAHYDERTGVHLEPTWYTLSLAVLYINYLRGIKFKS